MPERLARVARVSRLPWSTAFGSVVASSQRTPGSHGTRDQLIPQEVIALYPYEILVIFDPRPTDEDVAALLTRLQDNLKSLGGDVSRAESWGKRRLAYDIRKQREGTYAVIECSALPTVIKEFERQLGLNEQVLRFLSTRVPPKKRVRTAPKQQAPAPAAV